MRVYNQDNLLTGPQALIYNGLDCCVTREIFDVLDAQLTPATRRIYNFERWLQGPALEMTWGGFRVDREKLWNKSTEYGGKLNRLHEIFRELSFAACGRSLNPASPKQLQELFYHVLRCPPQHTLVKGERRVTTNREALEKLQAYYYARPFAATLLAHRDITKTLQFLHTGMDEDGRFRATFNPAATETGRWSSSGNPFGTGTNAQNISPSLRDLFVADPGYKIGSLDLEQAESRGVGAYSYYCTGVSRYLDACEAGDLHTTVAKLIWPHITDRRSADQLFYRDFSYRDMAKRGGHGTNYLGTAQTMARHLKVPTKLIAEFQLAYFAEFSEIKSWHNWVARQLQQTGRLTTLFGRERIFWGRPEDPAELRAAVAHLPQSALVDVLNYGLLSAWRDAKLRELGVVWLAQVHDAVVFQYPEQHEAEVIALISGHLRVPLHVKPEAGGPSRTLIVPSEASVGWNWGKVSSTNPYGLAKYRGQDLRRPLHPNL